MAKNKKDNEGQSDENSGNGDDSADNFGLPDIEYKPLDREKEGSEKTVERETQQVYSRQTSVTSEESANDSYDEEEPSSKAPLFIGLIIGVVILAAGFLIYKYWYIPRGEKAKKEQLAKEAADKKAAEEARLAQEREAAERKRQDSIALANAKPAVGTIETLSARTGRWFVIVSSDIDDDLLMDYAKKLSMKGVSTKVIPPYGDYKYYRLSITDLDTYASAQSTADGSKGEYGPNVWVMKY